MCACVSVSVQRSIVVSSCMGTTGHHLARKLLNNTPLSFPWITPRQAPLATCFCMCVCVGGGVHYFKKVLQSLGSNNKKMLLGLVLRGYVSDSPDEHRWIGAYSISIYTEGQKTPEKNSRDKSNICELIHSWPCSAHYSVSWQMIFLTAPLGCPAYPLCPSLLSSPCPSPSTPASSLLLSLLSSTQFLILCLLPAEYLLADKE